MPMVEAFTGIETDLTLLEWSDLNRPLMQRLSLEAPGTYAHTIAIANLAEAACRAIGANRVARARRAPTTTTSARSRKPQYFVENQAKGRNPHDALKPERERADHSRTTCVKDSSSPTSTNFRARCARSSPSITAPARSAISSTRRGKRDGASPDAAEYVYPGPAPADARRPPSSCWPMASRRRRACFTSQRREKVRDVVEHIVRQRMEQGQLADAPLTLRQIEAIKEEFIRVLVGMYHNRIDYPAASGGMTSEFASV